MKILLVHQNFPGQFKHLAPLLLQDPNNEVVAFTMNDYQGPAGLKVIRYQAAKGTAKDIHPWVAETETKVIRADAAFRAALKLRQSGFQPDLIVAHPGWGESLFLKQVWPRAKMLIYCEFHYASQGTDVGFDSEFPTKDLSDSCRIQMKNVNNFLHFDMADGGISPTEWQKSTFPEPFRSNIDVVHDGIDTNLLRPNPSVWLQVGEHRLTRNDEIITFVNRNLEPYRGYHIFMRALPELMKLRPNARILIVGGDSVSYGAKPMAGTTWKQHFLDEVKHKLDLSKVHFLGHIPYQHFVPLLQLSTVHVYLTYPFVLSWSLLEAMSCGCAIVASDTKPLHEAIIDGQTGLLTPFFSPEELARRVSDLLGDENQRELLGKNARQFAIEHYDLNTVSLPRTLDIINKYR
jgi:glycosyltransferase involved in cell wall biosynthesis